MLMTSASAAPAAYTMAATPSAKVPTPSSRSIFTRISVASGATPMVPSPLSAAATVPAVCEPWLNGSARWYVRPSPVKSVLAAKSTFGTRSGWSVSKPGVEHGDANAVAPLACVPGLGGVDRVVPVLEVEERIVVTARRRVRELHDRPLDRPERIDELDLHVRHDGADLRGLGLEVRVRRARDRDPDLRNRARERAPCGLHLSGDVCGQLLALRQDQVRLGCRRRACPRAHGEQRDQETERSECCYGFSHFPSPSVWDRPTSGPVTTDAI